MSPSSLLAIQRRRWHCRSRWFCLICWASRMHSPTLWYEFIPTFENISDPTWIVDVNSFWYFHQNSLLCLNLLWDFSSSRLLWNDEQANSTLSCCFGRSGRADAGALTAASFALLRACMCFSTAIGSLIAKSPFYVLSGCCLSAMPIACVCYARFWTILDEHTAAEEKLTEVISIELGEMSSEQSKSQSKCHSLSVLSSQSASSDPVSTSVELPSSSLWSLVTSSFLFLAA